MPVVILKERKVLVDARGLTWCALLAPASTKVAAGPTIGRSKPNWPSSPGDDDRHC